MSQDVTIWGAFALEDANKLDFDERRIEREAIEAFSLVAGEGWDHARRVEAAAAAAVTFVDEPTPEPRAKRVWFAKGTCSATPPANTVAMRGNSESSMVAFYDRDGKIVAAYVSRAQGPNSWAELCTAERAAAFFKTYHYPLERMW